MSCSQAVVLVHVLTAHELLLLLLVVVVDNVVGTAVVLYGGLAAPPERAGKGRTELKFMNL